jgi:UDP-N-acetylmuramate dehydrogenase
VDNIDFRENKQPKWNSWGSFFKNPSEELSAGKAIEEVWLKWYNHNWVMFSSLHANFLINTRHNWDWRDLIFMIDLAKTKVKDRFAIDLEPEVRIISN